MAYALVRWTEGVAAHKRACAQEQSTTHTVHLTQSTQERTGAMNTPMKRTGATYKKQNSRVRRALPYSKKTEPNTTTLTDPNTNEQFVINFDEIFQTPQDSLTTLMQEAGIEPLSQNEQDFENYVEPPQDLDAPTFLVNRKVIPLTLASLTTNSKCLILGVDIMSKQLCVYFADHLSNDHKLRLSLDELFIIIKDEVFYKISQMFTDTITKFNVGGLEVSLYKAKHGGKSIMFQRIADPLSNYFMAPTTWRKFGEARDLIKMHVHTLTLGKPYITNFTQQFVAETAQEIAKKTDYQSLVKMDIAQQTTMIREAMTQTSSCIVNTYAQDLNLIQTCDIPVLREEMILYHFNFLKEKVFEILKQ